MFTGIFLETILDVLLLLMSIMLPILIILIHGTHVMVVHKEKLNKKRTFEFT